MNLELSIIQDECTSCSQCPEIAPQHFYMGDDNIAYVQENGEGNPANPFFKDFGGKVLVAAGLEDAVIEAAELCPGACIYIDEKVTN
jgi:ferredoxin